MPRSKLFAGALACGALAVTGTARAEDPAPEEHVAAPEPSARVHITSAYRVTLARRAAGTKAWVFACDDPCDADLPLAGDYRLSGKGLRTSNEFTLRAEAGGGVELFVDPSRSDAWQLGVIVGGAGVLIDAGAIYLLVISLVVKVGDCTSPSALVSVVAQGVCRGEPSPLTLRTIALVALIPGTVATVVGLVKASSNWSTHIAQAPSAPGVASRPFLRAPEYAGPVVATPDPVPPMLFPLYGTRF